MKRVLIAADSFKDALTAPKVCAALARGVHRAQPDWEITELPLADGGEGTAEVLVNALGGSWMYVKVMNACLEPIVAKVGWLNESKTIIVETAKIIGLEQVPVEDRNPEYTTTMGLGQVIKNAVRDHRAERIILTLGGSSTNDGGIGMAANLGYRFLDYDHRWILPAGGRALTRIREIDGQFELRAWVKEVTALCDVQNPLLGPDGCAYTYAAQKGADAAAQDRLEDGMTNFHRMLIQRFHRSFDVPGAGAAGGLGAGLMAFLDAKLQPGAPTIFDLIGLDDYLRNTDLILTGEGRLDAQTARGKLIHALCRRAARFGVPVVAFCGKLEATAAEVRDLGLSEAVELGSAGLPLAEALAQTAVHLEKAANIYFKNV